MIRIDEITRGRFGNRILQYNSLTQLAHTLGVEASCVTWEGHNFFDNLQVPMSSNGTAKVLYWYDILDCDISRLNKDIDYVIGPYCLHNTFWELTKVDPRQFLKINDKYKTQLPKNKTNIGIHIRGDDILGADGNHGREIHPPEYYKKSIGFVEEASRHASEFSNTKYYVCTDDLNFISYVDTVKYLESKGIDYELGNKYDHFKDFATLSECDVLIASSSTFVVCAAFIGKENKKIIHSQQWVEKNVNHTPWHLIEDPPEVRKWQMSFDNFWVGLQNGGNQFYKIWRLL